MAYVVGVAFFLSSLLVQGMKIVFRVPRPWVADPSFSPVQGAIREATGYAFPSGHTQNAAAVLGSLGAMTRRALQVSLFTIAILVGFSRLYLGVHYLPDVLASLGISFLLVFLALKLVTCEPVSKKREFLLALLIALGAVVVLVIAARSYHGALSAPSHLRDSTRNAGAALGFAVGMYVERIYVRFSVRAKSLPFQIVKFALGIGGLLILREGVRELSTGLVTEALGYFLVVLWIILLFPLLIKRFFAPREEAAVGE